MNAKERARLKRIVTREFNEDYEFPFDDSFYDERSKLSGKIEELIFKLNPEQVAQKAFVNAQIHEVMKLAEYFESGDGSTIDGGTLTLSVMGDFAHDVPNVKLDIEKLIMQEAEWRATWDCMRNDYLERTSKALARIAARLKYDPAEAALEREAEKQREAEDQERQKQATVDPD